MKTSLLAADAAAALFGRLDGTGVDGWVVWLGGELAGRGTLDASWS